MSAQHTPGPWRVEDRQNLFTVLHEQRGKGDGYSNRVAECMYWSKAAGPQSSQFEAKANARLIAEAPTMLEALEQIASGRIVGEPNNHRDTLEVCREIARSAAAKARGEQVPA